MKRLKSIAGLAAGLILAGSMLAAPALAQPPDSVDTGNQTSVSVTIAQTGSFDAYFCNSSLGYSASTSLTVTTVPTLTTPGLATGQLAICYTDTLAYRPNFDTHISASPFAGGPTTIPLSGFKITQVYNVIQTYWGSNPDYGDIGQFVNEAYVGQGNPWPKAWSSNNTLDQARNLQFGYAGIGTGQSVGAFDVSLNLPIATQGGTYASTLTLSIVAGTQP